MALRDRLVHGVSLKSASHPAPCGLTRRRRPARRPVVAESHGRQLRRRRGGRLPGPRAGLKMGWDRSLVEGGDERFPVIILGNGQSEKTLVEMRNEVGSKEQTRKRRLLERVWAW